jgi:hypothetical protein
MIKKTFLLLCITISISCYSQTSEFQKGQIDVNAGIGIFSTLNANFNEAGVSDVAKSKWTLPPISLSADYGITNQVSVGVYVGAARSTISVYGDETEKDKFIIVGLRGLYHLETIEKADVYAGGMLGLVSITATQNFLSEEYKSKDTKLGYQLIVGGRYRLSDFAGVFVEIGYGVAIINLGLNLKF